MIDFIEYVVSEIKSKRLSKSNALSLIKQFSKSSTGKSELAKIHPLLHCNTSDLAQQSYTSIFTGMEFFLNDHIVNENKILPGVAYLEMVLAAAKDSIPTISDSSVFEIINVIWAKPIIVNEEKRVILALFASEKQVAENLIEFEIYTVDEKSDEETIHCQGQVSVVEGRENKTLDVEQLKERISNGVLESEIVYNTYRKIGLSYGAAHQGISEIKVGDKELLATIKIPDVAKNDFDQFEMHPSIMDSALQSSIGYLKDFSQVPEQPSVPFALKSLKVYSDIKEEMMAWVRYAGDNDELSNVTKLDIDIIDTDGNISVELRGFCSREMSTDYAKFSTNNRYDKLLFANNVWKENEISEKGKDSTSSSMERSLILYGELLKYKSECTSKINGLFVDGMEFDKSINVDKLYSKLALHFFEFMKDVQNKENEKEQLIQIVVKEEERLLGLLGFIGMLKSISLENSKIKTQLIIISKEIKSSELISVLNIEAKFLNTNNVIKYDGQCRSTLMLEEINDIPETEDISFKENGTYLITGGLGGLGEIFIKEILNKTKDVNLILVGRSKLSNEKKRYISELSCDRKNIKYIQTDISDIIQVEKLFNQIQKKFKGLSGIIHAAGILSDSLIVNKSSDDFKKVLSPKVAGAFNLDEFSKDMDLDFIALFSSGSSVKGNVGQTDYAAANGFMDTFSIYRNKLVEQNERKGKTISINWPLWQDGGMNVDDSTKVLIKQNLGIDVLNTKLGIKSFYISLNMHYNQILVLEGDKEMLRKAVILDEPVEEKILQVENDIKSDNPVANINSGDLEEKCVDFLKKELSMMFKLPSHKIDSEAPLEKYGLDSIMTMNLTTQLEKSFGTLSKTLFFEYQTIQQLSKYFIESYADKLSELLNVEDSPKIQTKVEGNKKTVPVQVKAKTSIRRSRKRINVGESNAKFQNKSENIAIVGLSGRYPESYNLNEYWDNLRNGKDCITEVPQNRWDWRDYYSEDRNKIGYHFSKWGGFIRGVDEFDPLFFNISPLEAEYLDPQERLFLQHAWMAIEDGGYTRDSLQIIRDNGLPGQVGVYVGVMYGEYQLYGAEASLLGNRMAFAGSLANIANRVSYFLNLHGPSMILDTMCSSSLTSIHLACQELKIGNIDLAIAGGVNVTTHPNKYLMLSGGQFISSDGHCQSFGEGGDGYIPGEGVGAVLLKRLSDAKKDGDHIYGIIRGSSLNHGGKTNGYTVPNPIAQADVISNAFKEADIDPRQISYIEAHGTGTKLGDPIEVAALSKSFQKTTSENQFCLLGSAKSNIGHCESAAGIAGITKVLLQIKHKEIVPSLHSEKLNPNIDFEKSPFVVNQKLTKWVKPVIDGKEVNRIAGISSFGAGGSNAHIIIEEYVEDANSNINLGINLKHSNVVVPLSAKTDGQLNDKARDLLDFIKRSTEKGVSESELNLTSLAYTLQQGREAMECRLGLLVDSLEDLYKKLELFINGDIEGNDIYYNLDDGNNDVLSMFNVDSDLKQTIEKWVEERRYPKLLDLWVRGLKLDWGKLYGGNKPKRVSLPTYPFSSDRYWIDTGINGKLEINQNSHRLHPLIHRNRSTLAQQIYVSTFTGDEFFLNDHKVKFVKDKESKVLPAVAYIEMINKAIVEALPEYKESMILELHNVVWAKPIIIEDKTDVTTVLDVQNNNEIKFEITTEEFDSVVSHCNGHATIANFESIVPKDIEKIKLKYVDGEIEPVKIYSLFKRFGINYGKSFQGLKKIFKNENQVFAELKIPNEISSDKNDFILHPVLLDSALQASMGLISELDDELIKPSMPFALKTVRILSEYTKKMYVQIVHSEDNKETENVTKLDIEVFDENGNVAVQMFGFTSREIDPNVEVSVSKDNLFMAEPKWKKVSLVNNSSTDIPIQINTEILLCNFSDEYVNDLKDANQEQKIKSISNDRGSASENYINSAKYCFEKVKKIILEIKEKTLLQVVIKKSDENNLLFALSGLLRTAEMENPLFKGQVIALDSDDSELMQLKLVSAKNNIDNKVIKFSGDDKEILTWKEIQNQNKISANPFRDNGVYIITGGLGGLGIIILKEILKNTHNANIYLTGRSQLSDDKNVFLKDLTKNGNRITYKQVNIIDENEVVNFVKLILTQHKSINGIVHSAGIISDNFIMKKTSLEFEEVLKPKVIGSSNLDLATKDVDLDFMIFFSSVASVLGNIGQSDYAAANGFMDQFANYRNSLVKDNLRKGQTYSINWPLWQNGGMKVDEEKSAILKDSLGIVPMKTSTGLSAFNKVLNLNNYQNVVLEGDINKIRNIFNDVSKDDNVQQNDRKTFGKNDKGEFELKVIQKKTVEFLQKEVSTLLKIQPSQLNPKSSLENYGIDSVLAMRLTNKLEETFGTLSKTLFFEYQTIVDLAGYFVNSYQDVLIHKVFESKTVISEKRTEVDKNYKKTPIISKAFKNNIITKTNRKSHDVAIIGISGRYPQADNLDQFWSNLKNGVDSVTEIPEDRWDNNLFFNKDRNVEGKTYSRWGGFINDVDKFDPLLFNISPKEAELIDPQERLFLETVWQTIEDAGYSKQKINVEQVGVYVGVMWGQYQLFGTESILAGNKNVPSSSFASIANRVSYFFNFNGPSISLDTMCSSSLTAIHLACEEISKGEINYAVAGGVNLSIHPQKYLNLSQGNFVSTDGRCRSFGDGGDGYVPGEGVGAVLLKSLEQAEKDGDRIYGVIKSSFINHGGKTNGYSVPNPNAQGELILEALNKANVDPQTLSYIEAHGTGTSLGDPIEITGLMKAFSKYTDKKQFCSIGSVKSNIGHLEAAAGIAAVTKSLLQLKHKQLVPSLHNEPLNSNIDFEESPFYVQRKLEDWSSLKGEPRRLGISSFGAGGSNAHLIIEEYFDKREFGSDTDLNSSEVFLLSARNKKHLLKYASKMIEFLKTNTSELFKDIVYTSQIGKSELNERLAIVADNKEDLLNKITVWYECQVNGKRKDLEADSENTLNGNVKKSNTELLELIEGDAGDIYLETLLQERDIQKISKLWIAGAEINWDLIHQIPKPKKISLPSYPFAKERYWIDAKLITHSVNSFKTENVISLQNEIEEEPKPVTFKPIWEKQNTKNDEDRIVKGITLLIENSDEIYNEIKSSNLLDSSEIVFIRLGDKYQKNGSNQYTVNLTDLKDISKIIENLISEGKNPDNIIHYLHRKLDTEVKNDGSEYLNSGIYLLLNLVKSLLVKNEKKLKLLSVYDMNNEISRPYYEAIGGFYKTLSQENSKVSAKVIGIANMFEITAKNKIDIIEDELCDINWHKNEIEYRFENRTSIPTRYIKDLKEININTESLNNLPLKQNGVYLISGGLGGLGFIFSMYLAKNFNANLVLFGRSKLGKKQKQKIEQLEKSGANVLYAKADVSKLEDMQSLLKDVKEQHMSINGIIHSAGLNNDSFIINKSREDMAKVLDPKVQGTINLDEITKNEKLDLFILFSSISGVFGNLGQSDYSFGNHFIDSFAHMRDLKSEAEKRYGKTISINWPYWKNGGMVLEEENVQLAQHKSGMVPLSDANGIDLWERAISSNLTQVITLYGNKGKISSFIEFKDTQISTSLNKPVQIENTDELIEKTENYLKEIISSEIKLDVEHIDSNEHFDSFGIDSVAAGKINLTLEKDIGDLPKTLFYEYSTIKDLAQYLVNESSETLFKLLEIDIQKFDIRVEEANLINKSNVSVKPLIQDKDDEIAIIGVHGIYPQSSTLDEYWKNLKGGKDLIELVPSSRWDYDKFYDPDPEKAAEGKIYCKWGGFLQDFDKFDSKFFNIPETEARIIDPQERLFLESVWAGIEDAGYTRESLKQRYPKDKSADVGVFAGVTTNSYHLLAPEEWNKGNMVTPGSMPWSIVNRVSYFFDFKGPSIPVDTACSSSLVALHMACDSLKRNECQIAIAGGVNLYLHPAKYQSFCQRRMLSLSGKCYSYGAGDDGFVPGEGVGTLVLKPLKEAEKDKDHIYAVIKGSAYNHSGKSNGYSAPNPNSQSSVIGEVLDSSGVDVESIGYIEGHGTGTQLGDNLEVTALTNAFKKFSDKKQYCAIGSVKGNIGHSESAAGVAGIAKILLQFKNKQLVPSINSDDVNPNIDFENTPFYLQKELIPWHSNGSYPRRALINSFGAGGVNSSVLLEDYESDSNNVDNVENNPSVIVLSAADKSRLKEYVNRMLEYVGKEKNLNLQNVAYTLQTGREHMSTRIAFLASSKKEFIENLKKWRDYKNTEGVYEGDELLKNKKRNLQKGKEISENYDSIDLSVIAKEWTLGVEINWNKIYKSRFPNRISIPTYPFAKDRYWITNGVTKAEEKQTSDINASLHPLISYNSSNLKGINFSSILSDDEFYAKDHAVNNNRIFPGSGFIEMACVSASIAGDEKVSKIQDIVWAYPLSFNDGKKLVQTELKSKGEAVEYKISSFGEENEYLAHSEGRILFSNQNKLNVENNKPVKELKENCVRKMDGSYLYSLFKDNGFDYGDTFQTIKEFSISKTFALSKLVLADSLKGSFNEFILHPSIIDGALQTVIGLIHNDDNFVPHLPFAIDEIEIFRPISEVCYAYAKRVDKENSSGMKKFNIQIISENGIVLVNIKNFFVRPIDGVSHLTN